MFPIVITVIIFLIELTVVVIGLHLQFRGFYTVLEHFSHSLRKILKKRHTYLENRYPIFFLHQPRYLKVIFLNGPSRIYEKKAGVFLSNHLNV